MPRQHQDSLLDAARQGEEGHVLTQAVMSPLNHSKMSPDNSLGDFS